MNEKTKSNSMRNMNKNNTSVLIQRLWYSTKRNETMNDFPVIGHPCFAYRILGLYQERLQNFSRVLSRSTLLGWGFKRFRYPFILQILPATVAFQVKDLITAFTDIYSFLLSVFSWSSVIFFVNKFCVFFHMGTIFFKRLLLFFNRQDVDLYVGYLSLKTLHYLVKIIGVRAWEARGAAAPPPPLNFGQLSFLGQQEKNWAKPIFKDVSMVISLF